jgi:dipeptidyl aminopeptidase/acylaminoacyl peptidase
MHSNRFFITAIGLVILAPACAAPPTEAPLDANAELSREPIDAADPIPETAATVAAAVAAGRCLRMVDHRPTAPLPLRGKLVVSYWENTIDESQGDPQELGLLTLGSAGGIRRLTRNLVNESEIDISPDGRRILYTVRPGLDDFSGHTEIWISNVDGSQAVRLLSGEPMGGPVWQHPGGTKFSFITWRNDSEEGPRLFTYDLATKQVTPLAPHLQGIADPEISYDGRLVAFKMPVDGDRDYQPSIYVMGSDGTGLRRLTSRYSDHDPVFSQDGKKLYFERYYGPGDWFDASQDRTKPEHNLWGIVEVDIASGAEKVIVPHDRCGKHLFWLPTISPDGSQVMYVHNHNFDEADDSPFTELWVSKIDGAPGSQQKVPGSEWAYFFDWTR